MGADPGGKNKFGVAILGDDGTFATFLVSCVDAALKHFPSGPKGLGIDSPLWWSSGPGGGRRADQWLRDTYKISSGIVQTANSLRGAVLIQGHLLIEKARENHPRLPITEAHPKALLRALEFSGWSQIKAEFALDGPEPSSEHERDAILAAVAAREGFSGRWGKNLSRDRHPSEQDPAKLWFGPVHYWWPD